MSEQVRRVWISTCAHDRATGEWLTVKGEVVPTDDYAALEAENAKLRAELERRAVDGWKLVPVEPTSEMVIAAEEAHMPFGDMDIALRMAILSAPSALKADDPVKAQTACEVCDGTGDVHRIDGEWLGKCPFCDLPASPAIAAARKGEGA